MEHNLQHTIAILRNTPSALNSLLRDLPEFWTTRNEGENTMTIFDVIAHLVYLEHTDWMTRAKVILEHGETRAFDPVDREGGKRISDGKALPDLLDEFAKARAANIVDIELKNLTSADLARNGKHPALGAVTLSQLLATWAMHDMTHLHQISRIIAHQYRDAVGPWSKYLGVMQCNGHSSS